MRSVSASHTHTGFGFIWNRTRYISWDRRSASSRTFGSVMVVDDRPPWRHTFYLKRRRRNCRRLSYTTARGRADGISTERRRGPRNELSVHAKWTLGGNRESAAPQRNLHRARTPRLHPSGPPVRRLHFSRATSRVPALTRCMDAHDKHEGFTCLKKFTRWENPPVRRCSRFRAIHAGPRTSSMKPARNSPS